MRIAWLTDIHLDFLEPGPLARFLSDLAALPADALAISGDIAQADTIVAQLQRLADAFRRPIYFVLGNHDFYHGSIRRVRGQVEALSGDAAGLYWLPAAGVVPVGGDWALVGHDGWADARLGDYPRSMVMMNDYLLIEELAGLDKAARWRRLQSLADEAAEFLRGVVGEALGARPNVVVLTHVPPFREACWYEGRISDDEWLPHFSSLATGQVLLEAAAAHPRQRIVVLCGHTHGEGRCWPLPNLEVRTGGATYGKPQVQEVLQLA